VIVAARILATGAFLAIARIPFVMPLALLTGVSVIIPYLGSVLRLLAIGAAAWATRGSGGALAAMSFLAAYDVVENYVLSPIVYRRALGISALGQLFAVLFLGYHFGVAGAVLAIPLAATVQIVSRAILSPIADHASPASRPEGRSAGVDAQHGVPRRRGESPHLARRHGSRLRLAAASPRAPARGAPGPEAQSPAHGQAPPPPIEPGRSGVGSGPRGVRALLGRNAPRLSGVGKRRESP
jgi:AI-2E family transporter